MDVISIGLLLIGLGISTFIYVEDKQEQNKKELYEYYSHFSFDGESCSGVHGGVCTSTPISNLLNGYLSYSSDDNIGIECKEDAVSVYKKIIADYPYFPFTYIAMANCNKRKYGLEWNFYAKKGLDILNHTTDISGHHIQHDLIKNSDANLLK